jgi:hypothetical protein
MKLDIENSINTLVLAASGYAIHDSSGALRLSQAALNLMHVVSLNDEFERRANGSKESS